MKKQEFLDYIPKTLVFLTLLAKIGGSGGIRTHGTRRYTAFRVRLVMATSIRFHNYLSGVLTAKGIISRCSQLGNVCVIIKYYNIEKLKRNPC